MSEHRAGDTARVMDALRRSVRALRTANQNAKRELGVSAAQLFVLRQIAETPGLSLAELAERTHTAQSSVSEVVSRLMTDGYVAKRQGVEDRRRIMLEVTDRGRGITERVGPPVQERLIAGLARLSAEDRRGFADLFEAWLRASGLDVVPATMFFEINMAEAFQMRADAPHWGHAIGRHSGADDPHRGARTAGSASSVASAKSTARSIDQ